MSDAERLAKRFHEIYEQMAPDFGYETRQESAKPWADVPEKNKKLMIAVCHQILYKEIRIALVDHPTSTAA
jgi:hypothetical protein